MSDYESNYYDICCPYCEEPIYGSSESGWWVDGLSSEDEDFFQCEKCTNFFKASLFIYKEYTYTVSEPTEKEIKEHNLVSDKKEEDDKIKDVEGQVFLWDNLFPDKS